MNGHDGPRWKMDNDQMERAAQAFAAAKREASGLHQAFFEAALDTLRKGAPGLSDQTRVVLARSIALKCIHAEGA